MACSYTSHPGSRVTCVTPVHPKSLFTLTQTPTTSHIVLTPGWPSTRYDPHQSNIFGHCSRQTITKSMYKWFPLRWRMKLTCNLFSSIASVVDMYGTSDIVESSAGYAISRVISELMSKSFKPIGKYLPADLFRSSLLGFQARFTLRGYICAYRLSMGYSGICELMYSWEALWSRDMFKPNSEYFWQISVFLTWLLNNEGNWYFLGGLYWSRITNAIPAC